MFLNQLNNSEKESFLKMAISVIQADDKIEESEKLFIAEYAKEMDLLSYDFNEKYNAVELAKQISDSSSDAVKRIFIIELTACAYTDGEFGKQEQNLLNGIVKAFGLTDADFDITLKLLQDYMNVATRLSTFVQEGK